MKTHSSGKLKPIKQGEIRNSKGISGSKLNSGRTPTWFKDKLKSLTLRDSVFRFFGDVLSGKPVEPHVSFGKIVLAPASVNSRIYAWEKICERGWGKVLQELQHSGGVDHRIVVLPPETRVVDKQNGSTSRIGKSEDNKTE